MKNKITRRDYELISAYLDNQLGSKDRAYLEARLTAIPELRKEFHEISTTRLMLHSVPKLRAPRNYFVNAQQLGIPVVNRAPSRLAPMMGIVSAVSTILLVLVLFGESLLTPTQPVALAPAQEAAVEAFMVEEEPSVGQEALRSVEATELPTDAAPMAMMEAPSIESPTPATSTLKIEESGSVTPTTIYLFAYPATSTPTATPTQIVSILESQQDHGKVTCEEYWSNPEAYPTLPYLRECQLPTDAGASLLQVVEDTQTPTPTTTITPTYTPSPSPTHTPSPTFMPSSTSEPSATTEVFLEAAPAFDVGSTAKTPPEITPSVVAPAAASSVSTEDTMTTPDRQFTDYVLLAVEISLATIAILAGTSAILLRIRAGR